MQRLKFDLRWTLVLPWIAFFALVIVYFRSDNSTASHAIISQQPAPTAQTGQPYDRPAPPPSPTATLAESILAADILVKAGKMAPPPSLAESMIAADMLIKAGKMAPPPSLAETWTAIDQLIKAGELPTPPWALDVAPTPTLREILEAADVLVKAGKMAPPSGAADHTVQNAPPPPPVPTSTSVPVLPAVAEPTATTARPTSTPVPPPTVAPPTKAAAAAASTSSPGGWFDEAFDAAVFAGVNQRRASAGLQPLSVEPRLANAAASYAKVLADNNWFSHTGPDGSTLVTRTEAAGFPFTVQIGEVLAWGSNGWTPAEIVQAWMDSPAHREQIMSGVYSRAGVGCYFSKSTGTTMVRCAMELAGS